MAVAGIPWWTTDIGGFHGASTEDPNFRPLLMRWFEYGAFSPVFYDFSADSCAWNVDDQYMFGPDLMVAPVIEECATAREVYLPKGAKWTNAWTGEQFEGGQTITVDAPIDIIPLFTRDDAALPIKV